MDDRIPGLANVDPEEVTTPAVGPTTTLGDNKAMNEFVVKEGTSSKSRHFERSTIFVKYAVQKLMVVCKLVGTAFMIADTFTKARKENTFKKMRAELRNLPDEPEESKFARLGRLLMNALTR